MQIKIYFSDLKPEKQWELLPKLQEFFDREIPSPLVIFDRDFAARMGIVFGLIDKAQTECVKDDASERLEQDAQLASENGEDEEEREDVEYEF